MASDLAFSPLVVTPPRGRAMVGCEGGIPDLFHSTDLDTPTTGSLTEQLYISVAYTRLIQRDEEGIPT